MASSDGISDGSSDGISDGSSDGSSDGMLVVTVWYALHKKLLRFFPVSYTSCLFHKATSGYFFPCIFSFQAILKSLLLPWRNDREVDTSLFSSDISIYLSYSFYILMIF